MGQLKWSVNLLLHCVICPGKDMQNNLSPWESWWKLKISWERNSLLSLGWSMMYARFIAATDKRLEAGALWVWSQHRSKWSRPKRREECPGDPVWGPFMKPYLTSSFLHSSFIWTRMFLFLLNQLGLGFLPFVTQSFKTYIPCLTNTAP